MGDIIALTILVIFILVLMIFGPCLVNVCS